MASSVALVPDGPLKIMTAMLSNNNVYLCRKFDNADGVRTKMIGKYYGYYASSGYQACLSKYTLFGLPFTCFKWRNLGVGDSVVETYYSMDLYRFNCQSHWHLAPFQFVCVCPRGNIVS